MDNLYGDLNIKMLFMKIIGKLERIEEKLDETTYLQEKFFKSDFVERVKAAKKIYQTANILNSKVWMISWIVLKHDIQCHRTPEEFRRNLKSYTGKTGFAMYI